MRIIRRYLLAEISGVFFLSLFILTLVFMSQRLIQLAEWGVNRGVGLAPIIKMMFFLLPQVFQMVLPMVTLFAVLLAVGRLSSDHELTALKASGVSLFRLLPPALLFGGFAASLSLLVSQVLLPAAARANRALRYEIVATKTEAAIVPRTFVNLFFDLIFFVDKKREDGKLRGVLVVNDVQPRGQPILQRQFIFARTGRFLHHPETLSNELVLNHGLFIQEDRRTGREEFASFTRLQQKVALDPPGTSKGRAEEEREMLGFWEMREAMAGMSPSPGLSKKALRERRKLEIQFHERLAFPLACLALCFWAVPLGVQPPRSGRARSIIFAVLLAAVYYYLMVLGKFAALYGHASPAAGLWLPELFITGSGLYMLWRKSRERPVFLLSLAEEYARYGWELVRERMERRGTR